jgi:hypothetical protein
MVHPTDEMLMAYADDELDPALRAAVEAAVGRDPRLRARLSRFAQTGAPVAALYQSPMTETIPHRILSTIMDTAIGREEHRRNVPSQRLLAGVWQMLLGGPRWRMALACSILLLLGAGGIWQATRTGERVPKLVAVVQDRLFARGLLKQALETVPSRNRIDLGSGPSMLSVEAVLTFQNRQRAFCRQYGVTSASGNFAGVACRGGDGEWRIDIHAADALQSSRSDRTTPAGRTSSDIEATVSQAMEGDALGREDEEALIRKSWQR